MKKRLFQKPLTESEAYYKARLDRVKNWSRRRRKRHRELVARRVALEIEGLPLPEIHANPTPHLEWLASQSAS